MDIDNFKDYQTNSKLKNINLNESIIKLKNHQIKTIDSLNNLINVSNERDKKLEKILNSVIESNNKGNILLEKNRKDINKINSIIYNTIGKYSNDTPKNIIKSYFLTDDKNLKINCVGNLFYNKIGIINRIIKLNLIDTNNDKNISKIEYKIINVTHYPEKKSYNFILTPNDTSINLNKYFKANILKKLKDNNKENKNIVSSWTFI